jgi:hypothetical protein
VVLLAFELLFHSFSLVRWVHLPFPFSTKFICGFAGTFWELQYLLVGCVEVFDFCVEGDDVLLLLGTYPPSAQKEQTIVFVMALLHEYFRFVHAAVAFPVATSILDKVSL